MGSRNTRFKSEGGYTLVAVFLLVTITALAGASSIGVLGNGIKTMSTTNSRTVEYFKDEQVLGQALQWMRDNSTGMTDVFGRSKFYSTFVRRAAQVGINDLGSFSVFTKIAPLGRPAESIILTNDSVILRGNFNSTVTGNFPLTTDTRTGSGFNPLSAIQTVDFGTKKVRVTLLDAIPVDPSRDFGATGPVPQTDFQPLYRLDVLDRISVPSQDNRTRGYLKDRGGHLSGHVLGRLVYDYGIGFYGRDHVELRQPCNSYVSNNGPYSTSSARANCPVGSNAVVSTQNNTNVYGSVRTNGTISSSPPFGGKVCADMNCAQVGSMCQGPACEVASLPTFSSWNSYCPTNRGAITPCSGSVLTVAGNAPNDKCWSRVAVSSNRVITLTSTTFPYFIDELNIANNGRVNFAPSPSTGTITLYVRKITGDTFNGNQVFNVNNRPYQLRLNYLGTDNLRLNGTAAMHTFVIAPYAAIQVQGNFTFRGGIKATSLTFTGNGSVHYDESGDITTLKGMNYQIRNLNQVYRQ